MEAWKRLDRLHHLRNEALARAAECREAVQRCEQYIIHNLINAPALEVGRLAAIYRDGVAENEEEAEMFAELIAREKAS